MTSSNPDNVRGARIFEYEIQTSQDPRKLADDMKSLASNRPGGLTYTSEAGEAVIAGPSMEYLENYIQALKETWGSSLTLLGPHVRYREIVLRTSKRAAVTKSMNKKNSISLSASPLPEKAVDSLEAGEDVSLEGISDNKKIWKTSNGNVLVDMTSGPQHLDEVKDSLITGFTEATRPGAPGGPLAEEPIFGVRFDIIDVTLHAEAPSRSARQIWPMMLKAIPAAMGLAEPALQEPVYPVEFTAPEEKMEYLRDILLGLRGRLKEETSTGFHASLPIVETFDMEKRIRRAEGKVTSVGPQSWQGLDGNMYDFGTEANRVVTKVRERKYLDPNIPKFE